MAAELVETNPHAGAAGRVWARRLAAVQPEWAETIGAHLVKRSYSEPRWDPRSGRAVATETVTLYGLPIVSGRSVGYDRVDASAARDIFVRAALVEGDWGPHRARYPFLVHNRQFAADVGALEDRLRRRHLLDDESMFEYYDTHVPGDVVSVRHFDRWWRDAQRPGLLELTPLDLRTLDGEAVDLDGYPDVWTTATGVTIPLMYRFEPGLPLDGVTARVPLAAINQVSEEGFDWLVPGYRNELVSALVRTLPKSVRRQLIPAAETVEAAIARLGEPRGRLVDALAAALGDVSGVRVDPDDFAPAELPDHLRMHYVVIDSDGTAHDAGDDLEPMRVRLAGTARAAIADAARDAGLVEERRGIVDWDVGTLPRSVETTRDDVPVKGFPALLDTGDSVALRVVTSEELQLRVHRSGVRRLLLLTAPPSLGAAARELSAGARLAIAASSTGLAELAAECRAAAVDAVLADHPLPWDAAAFEAVRADVRARAPAIAGRTLTRAVAALEAAVAVRDRLTALVAPALAGSVADAAAHLERLLAAGWVERAGADGVADVARYVSGIGHRLDRLAGDVPRDLRRMAEVRPLERRFAAIAEGQRRGMIDPAIGELGRQLEELRISVFAQQLGVRGSVSRQKLDRALRQLGV
jgi:ATP-dependent helicase HrpA